MKELDDVAVLYKPAHFLVERLFILDLFVSQLTLQKLKLLLKVFLVTFHRNVDLLFKILLVTEKVIVRHQLDVVALQKMGLEGIIGWLFFLISIVLILAFTLFCRWIGVSLSRLLCSCWGIIWFLSFATSIFFILLIAELALKKLESTLIFRPRIECQLGPHLEAHVPLIPSEYLLVILGVVLEINVSVAKTLRRHHSVKILYIERDVVAIFNVNLIVFVHY